VFTPKALEIGDVGTLSLLEGDAEKEYYEKIAPNKVEL